MRPAAWLLLIFGFLVVTRLLQSDLLWIEEAYPAAAAQQMLDGRLLYRDFWFDKPPLFPAVYLLWGARGGVALRVGGALFVFLCCLALYRFARDLWTGREGLLAAVLLAWYLTFGIPAAVMALAPDLLMILPHCLAVWLAWKRRPLASGAAAGVAMLINTKAVFVLAACAAFSPRAVVPLLAGFVLPNAVAAAWMWWSGALSSYWQQVWDWGFIYSRETFIESPLREGVVRTLNWAGFHAALVIGAAMVLYRERSRQFALWVALAAVGVVAGWRFFPRYYFLLLPPLCLLSARAVSRRPALALLLLIPAIRFGPRLVNHSNWPDTAMMNDSRAAAALIMQTSKPGDTLLVWGYRPDIYAFTRLPAGARFLDSQPLTGVIADRHLIDSRPSAPGLAAANRRELTGAKPTFIVDGLGPYNPNLAIDRYADLRDWLAGYQLVAATQGARIYRLR